MSSVEGQEPKQPREGTYSSSHLEQGIAVIAIAIASIGPEYFFTRLWWKVLRPRLKALSEHGSRVGRLVLAFT